jgi:putative addiction module component (TIGR02574 family)
MSAAAIQDAILGLPATERVKLIDVLWESLSSTELKSREAAWAKESERRIDAFEAGKLKARDAQSVLSDLRRDLRK